jgi:hypothetical protein
MRLPIAAKINREFVIKYDQPQRIDCYDREKDFGYKYRLLPVRLGTASGRNTCRDPPGWLNEHQ